MSRQGTGRPLRIWLTGATSGIGLALLEALVDRGDHVIATGRNRDRLEELRRAHGDQVIPLPGDVSSADDCRRLADELTAMAPLDWAVLNAGTCEYMDIGAFDPELVSRVINTNIVGTARSVGAVLPTLRHSVSGQQRPLLAIVSSSAWWFPFTRAEAYGASKAGLTYFAESLRADLAGEGIDVSVVSPGFVRTPLTDQNDFPMPFLMEADDAAAIMLRGLLKHRRDIHFPKRFTWSLKLIACLPRIIRDRMAAAMAGNRTD